MKYFILIVVLLSQNYNVSSLNLLKEVSDKLNLFTSSVTDVWESFKMKFTNLIFSGSTNDVKQELKSNGFEAKPKVKTRYNDSSMVEISLNGLDGKGSHISRYLRSEPTALMSTPQLATLHGKRIETHVVVTKDGYLLTVHNLKNTINESDSYGTILPECTAILHHGPLGSSADWILLGPKKSLPYLLMNANCDVWLINTRGNYYSRGHVSKKIDSNEFWNFSWQEMGQYDLPAVVDYIRRFKSTTDKITFIGHSMGATVFLAMLSYFPEYNEYFSVAVFLAPLVFLVNSKSPLSLLASLANSPHKDLLNFLGEGEFMPNRRIPLWIAQKYCEGPEMFCTNPLLFLTGSIRNEQDWDESLTARILYHVPAGGSTKTILHYAQMIESGNFHEFGNARKEFSLKSVTVPTVLFSSSNDVLATTSDVLRLFYSISCPIDNYVIREHDFRHTDFVWNPLTDKLVFAKVIEYLSRSKNCNLSKMNDVM